ncbi:hypothetical protein ATE84_4784 [Aquimarina sp. MAR_2010_214]|nr:hypothetical protein ATE84_4784 [Aquimarina sp. MAR_2010_214]
MQGGIENLEKEDGDFPLTDIRRRCFLWGNISLWIKTARAIRVRAHLHQGSYTEALTDAQASFAARADNLRYTYTSTKPGQWYRFNDGRTGDTEFHPFIKSLMDALMTPIE